MKRFRDTRYIISEDGKIYNKTRELHQTRKKSKKSSIRAYVGLSIDKKQKCFNVARVVAEVYIPNPNNLPQVNHIDGNTLNNNYLNLEWCTQSENIRHAIKIGIKRICGEENPSAKLAKQTVKSIREEYSNTKTTLRKLASKYKVSYTTIRYIIKGKTWNT